MITHRDHQRALLVLLHSCTESSRRNGRTVQWKESPGIRFDRNNQGKLPTLSSTISRSQFLHRDSHENDDEWKIFVTQVLIEPRASAGHASLLFLLSLSKGKKKEMRVCINTFFQSYTRVDVWTFFDDFQNIFYRTWNISFFNQCYSSSIRLYSLYHYSLSIHWKKRGVLQFSKINDQTSIAIE